MRFVQFLQYTSYVAQSVGAILLPVLMFVAIRFLHVKAKKG